MATKEFTEVDADTIEQLQTIADANGVDLSSVIEEALSEYIEKRLAELKESER